MDKKLLDEMIRDGYISVQTHPSEELRIYNYTPSAVYDNVWNDATLSCRGLIMDFNGNIIARPFHKFFNYEQHMNDDLPRIPTGESFKVTEKMDGSLGILYFASNKPFIATRGSFISEQSAKGTIILQKLIKKENIVLDEQITYLFEIIYPSNRIVVNYGNEENLILIGMIETSTGIELPLDEKLGFTVVPRYEELEQVTALEKLREVTDQENKEGFVIQYESGFRVKVKFSEYMRLHKILTGINSKTIWEFLKEKDDFRAFLVDVPDEFTKWVDSVVDDFQRKYSMIENDAKKVFSIASKKKFKTRKEYALFFKENSKNISILFSMLDRKEYDQIIWKLLKPKYEKPFSMGEM